jgi:hypothetical protein
MHTVSRRGVTDKDLDRRENFTQLVSARGNIRYSTQFQHCLVCSSYVQFFCMPLMVQRKMRIYLTAFADENIHRQ